MTERRQGWDRSADMPEIAVSMDHHGMGFKLLAVSRQKPSVDPCLVDELGGAAEAADPADPSRKRGRFGFFLPDLRRQLPKT